MKHEGQKIAAEVMLVHEIQRLNHVCYGNCMSYYRIDA